MDAATLALLEQIFSVLVQAIKLGIQYAPEVIADLEMAYGFVTSGTTLTPEQLAQAETAVQTAHAALQAQGAADLTADAAADTTGA